jgi:hypothetical protein
MLSYAEHGKFQLPTQGRQPREAAKKAPSDPVQLGFCDVPRVQLDHGIAPSAMADSLGDRNYCDAALRSRD